MSMMALQPSEMIWPVFARTPCDFRVSQLQADVFEIAGESSPRQPFDIFEKKSAWSNLADSADSFGEHIPVIAMTTMSSAKREWLAGRSTGDEIDTALKRPKINFSNVAFNQRPFAYWFHATNLIFTNGITAITIPFNDGGSLKASVTHANAKTTRTCEKLNGLDFIHLPESS